MGQLETAVGENWKTTRKQATAAGGKQYQGSSDPHTVNGYAKAEVVSALQKCIRRGMEQEALYWASELLASGESYKFWRRIAAITAEDVGLADPMMPSKIAGLNDLARLNQEWNIPFMAVMLLCRAPKNREADDAAWLYEDRRKKGWKIRMPAVARDGHTPQGKARLYEIARNTGEDFWRVWAREFYFDAALLRNPVPLETNGVDDYYKREVLQSYDLPYDTYDVELCSQERILTGSGNRDEERAMSRATNAEVEYHQKGDENGEPIEGVYAVQSFTDPSTWYEVDQGAQTCTCPAHTTSGGRLCKHIMFIDRKKFLEGEVE